MAAVGNLPTEGEARRCLTRESAKGAKEPIVAISADAKATHQAVVNVMEAARLAGYNHISFTTQTRR